MKSYFKHTNWGSQTLSYGATCGILCSSHQERKRTVHTLLAPLRVLSSLRACFNFFTLLFTNKTLYCTLMLQTKVLLPFLRQEGDVLFQQDNAHPHTAAGTQRALRAVQLS